MFMPGHAGLLSKVGRQGPARAGGRGLGGAGASAGAAEHHDSSKPAEGQGVERSERVKGLPGGFGSFPTISPAPANRQDTHRKDGNVAESPGR